MRGEYALLRVYSLIHLMHLCSSGKRERMDGARYTTLHMFYSLRVTLGDCACILDTGLDW